MVSLWWIPFLVFSQVKYVLTFISGDNHLSYFWSCQTQVIFECFNFIALTVLIFMFRSFYRANGYISFNTWPLSYPTRGHCKTTVKVAKMAGRLRWPAAKMAVFSNHQIFYSLSILNWAVIFARYWCIRPQKWPEIQSMSMLLSAFLDIWIAINCQNEQSYVSKVVKLQLWCSRHHKRVLKKG